MKFIIHFILKQFHFVIFINTLLAIYSNYQEVGTKVEELENRDKSITQRMNMLRGKISKAKEIENNLEISKKRLDDVARQIDSIQRKLPETISDTEVLEFFSQNSSELNIANVQQSPLKEEEKDFYFAKNYQYNATGTFLQFIVFFEQLYNSEKIFNIIQMKIERTKEKVKGRFQILDLHAQIEAMRYNSQYRTNANIDVKKMIEEKRQHNNKKTKPKMPRVSKNDEN